jgi:hypothetical protein
MKLPKEENLPPAGSGSTNFVTVTNFGNVSVTSTVVVLVEMRVKGHAVQKSSPPQYAPDLQHFTPQQLVLFGQASPLLQQISLAGS